MVLLWFIVRLVIDRTSRVIGTFTTVAALHREFYGITNTNT